MSLSSSRSPSLSSDRTRAPLPRTVMSLPGRRFSFAVSSAAFPPMTVEFHLFIVLHEDVSGVAVAVLDHLRARGIAAPRVEPDHAHQQQRQDEQEQTGPNGVVA